MSIVSCVVEKKEMTSLVYVLFSRRLQSYQNVNVPTLLLPVGKQHRR